MLKFKQSYRDWNDHVEGFHQKAIKDENDVYPEVRERPLVSTYCPCSNVRHQEIDKHVAEDKKVDNFWNIAWSVVGLKSLLLMFSSFCVIF